MVFHLREHRNSATAGSCSSALRARSQRACSRRRARDARITKIEMTRTTAFGGYSFEGVGQFDKITGIATGEVNPNDPRNAVIVDLALAPRLAERQRAVPAQLLHPAAPGLDRRAINKVMYEPPNRGGKTHGTLNRGVGGNDPGAFSTEHPRQRSRRLRKRSCGRAATRPYGADGKTTSGALTGLSPATGEFPIAKGPGDTTITGPAYEYIVTGGTSFGLTYPAASTSQAAADATLTHRVHLNDAPVVVPPAAPGVAGWKYTTASATAIRLVNATGATSTSPPTTSTSSRTRRRIRRSSGWALQRCATSIRSSSIPPRTISARPIRCGATSRGSTRRSRRNPGGCSTISGTWASTRTRAAARSSTA